MAFCKGVLAHGSGQQCSCSTANHSVYQRHNVLCRDPLANSFVAPLTADPAEDQRLVVEEFERSAEDDAEYGIDHLKNLDLHNDQGRAEPAAAG